MDRHAVMPPFSVSRVVRSLLLALGCALLVWVTARLGWRSIVAMLIDLRWTLLPAVALYAGHQVMRAIALTLCTIRPGSLPVLDAVAVRLAGEAIQYLTFSGPVVAEPTKAWLLSRRGLTTWEGLAATLAEYLASAFSGAVIAIAGLGYVLWVFQPTGPVRGATVAVLVWMVTFAVVCIVGIAGRLHIIGAILGLAARLPRVGSLLRIKAGGIRESEDMLIHVLRDRPRPLSVLLAVEAAGQLFLSLELYVLVSALTPSFVIGIAPLMEGATKFINAGFFFVPGQLGVAEGTYAIIFDTFGLPAAVGLAVSFARRLRSILTAGIGLALLSFLTRAERGELKAES